MINNLSPLLYCLDPHFFFSHDLRRNSPADVAGLHVWFFFSLRAVPLVYVTHLTRYITWYCPVIFFSDIYGPFFLGILWELSFFSSFLVLRLRFVIIIIIYFIHSIVLIHHRVLVNLMRTFLFLSIIIPLDDILLLSVL